jgi:antitoxin component of MazEF toxin-antitoxin module
MEFDMLLTTENLKELTKGLSTKSDKIRKLGHAGVATADIARLLGIRYQHARNVLKDAGLLESASPRIPPDLETKSMPAQETARLGVWLDIGEDASVAIPARLIADAGLKAGGRVYARVENGAIALRSQKAALAIAHEITRKYTTPGVSEVDAFIAGRRAEARRESEQR